MSSTPPIPNAPTKPPDDKAVLDDLLTRLEKVRGKPAIAYWTSPLARISLATELPLFDQLRMCGKCSDIDLLLYTNGGDVEAPWRFVSMIREFAPKFSILIPHKAMSSGTLMALGADEIVMTPLSVLGPIDPSRTHPLLPKREGAKEPEQISVQDMRHAMQFIREAAPQEPGFAYTPDAMAQIFNALFDKIHPLAIGAIEQSYALAKLIGTQCLRTHTSSETEIKKIIDKLCDDYKSHAYQISRREAKALGLKVQEADPPLEEILLDLLKFYSARPIGPFANQPPIKVGQLVTTQIAWLDSTRLKFRVEQQLVMGANSQFEAKGDQWVAY